MLDSIITLTANLGNTYRTEMVDGKEWWIVPGVILTEDVHSANNGALYYPAPELEKSAPAWDTSPLLKNHPKKDGVLAPVDQVEGYLDEFGLGEMRNTAWNGKVKSDYAFNMERCDKVDPRIRENIKSGKIMSVSSGLGHQIEKKESSFNGKAYNGIVREIDPDHVAILLDSEGACSVKAGCGCGFTGNSLEPFTVNEMSQSNLNRKLQDILADTFGYYGYIRDVYRDFFIYNGRDGQLFKQTYAVDGDTVSIGKSDPIKVKWMTEYRTEGGKFVGNCSCSELKGIKDMDKKAQIAALISSGTFNETDRSWLEGQPDTKIVVLHTKLTANAAPAVTPPVPTPVPAPVPAPREVTWNEYLASLPIEKREAEEENRRAGEQMKADLIATITANTAGCPVGTMSEDYLKRQPIAVLKVYAATTTPKVVTGNVVPHTPTPNYGGLAPVVPAVTANVAAPAAYKPPQLFTPAKTA